MSRNSINRLLTCLLLMVGAAVYANSLHGVFLLDDRPAIIDNPAIRQLWPPSLLLQAPPDAPGAGRPMVTLSLAVNYAVGGLDVRGYHLFNVSVHLLVALLLYGCIRRTLEFGPLSGRYEDRSHVLAFSAALLWLVHPLLTEPVDYITQRSESLMGLCLLLTILLVARHATGRRSPIFAVGAVLACAGGMACKETMVVAPPLILLWDRVYVAGSFRVALRERRGLYMGLAATWAWLGLLIATGPDYRAMAMGFETGSGWLDYARAQPEIVFGYLKRVFWPHPLIVDYGQVLPTETSRMLLSLAVILGLALATLAAMIHRKALGFLGVWFFMLLAPTSSFVPIVSEVGAERRMYMPLIAPLVLLVIGLDFAVERWMWRRRTSAAAASPRTVVLLISVALSLPLAATTVLRNRDYRSAESIWRSVVETRPGWRSHNALAAELFAQGRYEEALPHFRRAAELGQYLPQTWSNLGAVLQKLGRMEESIVAYRESLRLDPERTETHNNLAIAYGTLGRTEEALQQCREALRLDPANDSAHYNFAILLDSVGRRDAAIEQYEAALRLNPSNGGALERLATALNEEGRTEEARALRERLGRLRSGSP